jgi:hypothetical protein
MSLVSVDVVNEVSTGSGSDRVAEEAFAPDGGPTIRAGGERRDPRRRRVR